MIIDAVFMLAATVPVTFILVKYTSLAMIPLYIIVQNIEYVKVAAMARIISKGTWLQTLGDHSEESLG